MNIELQNVTKTYGKNRALDGVSLNIPAGQIVAVLGSNGSGKTTLLRCLAGMATPRRGSIVFGGKEFSRDDMGMRRQIMFMADVPFVFWEMSPLEHVGMCLNVYERRREDAVEASAKLFGELNLTALANSPMARLSRGQGYKAALSGMLLVDPEVWLLDEPFASGMDPQGIAVFKQRAREAAARGHTIIYTTQIVEVVQRFSDRVCVLHEGEVKGFDTFDALRMRSDTEPALKAIFDALKEA